MRMDYENYPDDYDFLDEGEYEEILAYLNDGDTEDERYSDEHREYARELVSRGIAARWGWSGHRHEWILATYDDAEAEEDWWYQCADY